MVTFHFSYLLQTGMSKVQSIERDNVLRKEEIFRKQVIDLKNSRHRASDGAIRNC